METETLTRTDIDNPASFKYWAFISYSHRDEGWAAWLHRGLEMYRVPRSLVGRQTGVGSIPRRLFPIFRDRDELPASADLGVRIREALERSHWLIVLCSRASAASVWVNEEIRVFRSYGRVHRILCLIVDGEPHASQKVNGAELECFPPALFEKGGSDNVVSAEPLAVDVRKGRDSKRDARLRILAGMFGVGFDELRLRERRRRRARNIQIALLGMWFLALIGSAYVLLADSGSRIPGSERIRIILDRHELSLLRPIATDIEVNESARKLRRLLVSKLLEELKVGHWKSANNTDQGGGVLDVWVAAQAMSALLRTPELTRGEALACMQTLDEAFSPQLLIEVDGQRYGWIPAHGSFARAEPGLWTVVAISIGLGRADLLEKERAHWMDRLRYAQSASTHYWGGEGTWYAVGGRQRPTRPSMYTSTLALLALLEGHAAGLPWDGSYERRDALLRETVRWLVDNFQEQSTPPGWVGTPGIRGSGAGATNDGLTLQIYSLLLRADEQVNIPIPDAIQAAMIEHLQSLEGRAFEYPSALIRPAYRFRDHLDQPRDEFISIRCLWYPWATMATSRWLVSRSAVAAAAEERVRIRRVLGHLVVRQADQVMAHVSKLKSTYPVSEILYSLTFLPPGERGI